MMLHVEGLHYAYPGWPATLRGVDLAVPSGTSAFLLGPSGSGKSTLLRCIAGLVSDYQGRIAWNDESLEVLPPHRRGVGFMFQEPALFPYLSVWQNVAFGLRYHGVARRDERREALRWLDLVELSDMAERGVEELSGGQRQRVVLARTLATRPRIVLLDEPFSALDRELRDALGDRVKALLAQQQVAALWVTHDQEEAVRLADRTWCLVDGRAVEQNP